MNACLISYSTTNLTPPNLRHRPSHISPTSSQHLESTNSFTSLYSFSNSKIIHFKIISPSPLRVEKMPSFLNVTLGPINLPPFIIFHATGLIIIGIHQIFGPVFNTTKPNKSTARNSPSKSSSQPLVQREQELKTITGVSALAIGLGYLSTSYMPTERNQWLYASVLVRILLAGVCGVRVLLAATGKGNLSQQSKREMLGIMVWDGFG